MSITKILLTGGGTGGSVSPLLAIAEELEKKDPGGFEFFWRGTRTGPEKTMVEKEGIKYKSISSGKLRRYFSLKNFFDPLFIGIGFLQSLFFILKWKPDLIMSAGGFVSVPVIWAGWLLRKKILIHQQDLRPGLANKLMSPFATKITVTFEESLKDYGKKAVWVGNPVRHNVILRPKAEGSRAITTDPRDSSSALGGFRMTGGCDLPLVLVAGGGTGAEAINKLVWGSLSALTKFCQIVHVTGKGKNFNHESKENYQVLEFLDHGNLMAIMEKADLIISRAGMNFLTEISFLGKPAILIPMPNSHQEDNARVFGDKEAAVVLEQKELTPDKFMSKIKELLADKDRRDKLGENAGKVMKKGANEEIAKIIQTVIASPA